MTFGENKHSYKNAQPKKEKKSDISKSNFTIIVEKIENRGSWCHSFRKEIENSNHYHCKSDMIFVDIVAFDAGSFFSSCQNMNT